MIAALAPMSLGGVQAAAARDIYAVDCRVAEVCRDMQIAGFAFDVQHARTLQTALLEAERVAAAEVFDSCGCLKPLSPKALGDAFFGELRAPIIFRSTLTGKPCLNVDAMRAYAGFADPRLARAALAVLAFRRARKCRATYVERPLLLSAESSDGRVHPSWLNYGAVSGRWSCQDPNLANLPRPENDPVAHLGGLRKQYRAGEGHVLVSFDASQLEFRVAAYASGDPVMIEACEGSDIHAANAAIIWPDAMNPSEHARLKRAQKGGAALSEAELAAWSLLEKLRSMAKQSGFAVCYMAEAQTVYARIVAAGIDVPLAAVEAMLSRLRRRFERYFAWQEARLGDAIRTGYAVEPITGRARWVGHDPSPPEVANLPIQGGAAGLLNTKLPAMVEEMRSRHMRSRLVASVYDSGTFECPEGEADEAAEIAKRVFEAPVAIRSSGKVLDGRFPIELKRSVAWS